MAFSADELRVLRRALATALNPAPLQDDDVQDCLRLADSVDEAVREAGRLRAFLLADLVRYRQALPGSLAGYLELLEDALAAGYDPGADDLAALRALRGNPAAAALLARCQVLAERSVRTRLAKVAQARAPQPRQIGRPRALLLALPGGRASEEGPKPPAPSGPTGPGPKPPAPGERPVPKPSEVFPPRRRPVPPPPPEERAVG
ncbi:hypothetical protein [Streptomyces roseicoloratus]|uniref:Uncharacterized protein n=1 Tax=Streptomyces roseicoloratus TaxID=2508722 RepID=A0ABY9S3A5_9ACTN|nr:hypothetical protein [Streptomyces roseicoloratus]WMX48937.1 hypothetical protein RGF97_18520 [Streptomyces roseicoloratus]